MKKFTPIALSAALILTGCAPTSQDQIVTLVAHDSFAISDGSIAEFEAQSGYKLEILRAGDAGSVTNRLVLTKNAPIGDVVFGIDNSFRGLAEENELIEGSLSEISYSDVCFNYDRIWFEENQVEPPATWRELVLPKYRELTVVSNPLTSSPGMGFLTTTVAAFGEEGFENFWRQLKDNGVRVAVGWEEAYFIEFVGILAGAKNPTGAKALIEFLLGEPFQSTMPGLMYVYPVNSEATVPEEWSKYGPSANSTIGEALDIQSNRSSWQDKWSAIFD
jgi:thiamine transport system substrate-binding protein